MKHIAHCVLVALLTLLSNAGAGRAEDIATFPLGEHYHVGRYLPVRVTNLGELRTRVGAVSGVVGVELPGGKEAVVPLLATAPIDGPRVDLRTEAPLRQRLQPLDEQQWCLVGTTSGTAETTAALSDLFPGRAIVTVRLDLADPLPGPALAWTALDAVVLDASAAARVSSAQLETLRAAATSVAIRSDARPAGPWPWEQRGVWWVLPPDLSAAVSLVQPDRYGPSGDEAGAPARMRRVVVMSLACFAVAVLAVSLLRRRRTWILVVGISILAAGGIAWWGGIQPTFATVVNEQRIGVWLDRYTHLVARADGPFRQPIADAAAWPIFFSRRHASDVDLRLECAADGTPLAFAGSLKHGQSIVFLTRELAADH